MNAKTYIQDPNDDRRAAARLTNGQMKEADLTGEMMRPFRE
jgi:hypothetical protein